MFIYSDGGSVIQKANGGYESYVIPSTVLSIVEGNANSYSFQDVRLNTFDLSFEEGSQIISIGSYSFFGCVNMRNVDFSNAQQLKTIGKFSFGGCKSLTSITFPKSLTTFTNYGAFKNCANLTSVVFPDGSDLIDLNSGTFYSDPLTSFRLPSKCKKLSAESFSCTYIQEFTIENDENDVYAVYNGSLFSKDFTILVSLKKSTYFSIHPNTTKIGYLSIGGCKGDFIIPKEITTFGLLSLYDFLGKSLTLLSPIKVVETRMFESCPFLERIVLHEGTEIIQPNAFKLCPRIKSFYLPYSLTSISFDGMNHISRICFYGNIQILKSSNSSITFHECFVGIVQISKCPHSFIKSVSMISLFVLFASS